MLTRTLLTVAAVALASQQGGWGVTNAQPHQVSRIYWELLPATEVLVPLQPRQLDDTPVRFHLVFHAFYPGRADRDWHTGLPAWPKGAPARLAVTAQAYPLTFAIPELAIRFTVNGARHDLTAPGRSYRNVPCSFASEVCTPTGVEADLDQSLLRALVRASRVEGTALGTPFALTDTDREALTTFARRIGL
jgi:hypothetical protein